MRITTGVFLFGILCLSPSPAWAGTDINKLVTQAEVEAALGAKVTSEVNKMPQPTA